MTTPRPGELTRVESKDLLRQIAVFGDPLPHLILTGGDSNAACGRIRSD